MSAVVSRIIKMPAIEPELKFAAALIADARDSCEAGDQIACKWLANCGPRWIVWLIPEGVDMEAIEAKIRGSPSCTKSDLLLTKRAVRTGIRFEIATLPRPARDANYVKGPFL